jgi:hydrogenase-4 component B
MNPITALPFSVGLLVLGAIITTFLGRYRRLVGNISFIFTTLAAICLFNVAFKVFAGGAVVIDRPIWEVPGIGASLLVRIDGLSALFLALIALVSILTSLYA